MTGATAAQDPNERFDVVTSTGAPTGVTKRRADVHRDGDWHRAIHVWVVGIDERGPFLTFQRRSLAKDTSPGKLDATVGGHFRAGESLTDTLREVEEEIGVTVGPGDLVYAGMRICVNDTGAGTRDQELQEVFFLRDERPLTGYQPNPTELAGLVRVGLANLLELLTGNLESFPAWSIAANSSEIETILFHRSELTQRPDRYLYRVAIAADLFLAGQCHFSV